MAAYSNIYTEQINRLCGQNAEFLVLNLAVHVLTITL
jgi:hypothetical protein